MTVPLGHFVDKIPKPPRYTFLVSETSKSYYRP